MRLGVHKETCYIQNIQSKQPKNVYVRHLMFTESCQRICIVLPRRKKIQIKAADQVLKVIK